MQREASKNLAFASKAERGRGGAGRGGGGGGGGDKENCERMTRQTRQGFFGNESRRRNTRACRLGVSMPICTSLLGFSRLLSCVIVKRTTAFQLRLADSKPTRRDVEPMETRECAVERGFTVRRSPFAAAERGCLLPDGWMDGWMGGAVARSFGLLTESGWLRNPLDLGG